MGASGGELLGLSFEQSPLSLSCDCNPKVFGLSTWYFVRGQCRSLARDHEHHG